MSLTPVHCDVVLTGLLDVLIAGLTLEVPPNVTQKNKTEDVSSDSTLVLLPLT